MKNVFGFFAILAMVILSSCTKEGPVGPAGPAGTNGTNGTNGINGNANVHVQNFTLYWDSWTHFGTQGTAGEGYLSNINCTLITSDIVNTGAVLAFSSGDNVVWEGLPLTIPNDDYLSSYYYTYQPNWVTIVAQDNDYFTLNPGTQYIKVVTIAGSYKAEYNNIDWKNYNEVESILNLKN